MDPTLLLSIWRTRMASNWAAAFWRWAAVTVDPLPPPGADAGAEPVTAASAAAPGDAEIELMAEMSMV